MSLAISAAGSMAGGPGYDDVDLCLGPSSTAQEAKGKCNSYIVVAVGPSRLAIPSLCSLGKHYSHGEAYISENKT